MIVRAVGLGLIAVLATSVPSMARVVIYTCELDVARSQGWVPEQVLIEHDTATDEVVVTDTVTNHFTGKPSKGEVLFENARRITFSWELRNLQSPSNQFTPAMKFRGTLQKPPRRISVTATPVGFGNSFRAEGTCQVR